LGDLIVDDNMDVSGYIHSSSSNLTLGDNVDIQGYIYSSSSNFILDDNVEITGYLMDTNSAVIVQDELDVQGRTWLRENLYTYGDSYSYGSVENNGSVTNNANETTYGTETNHGNSINNAYLYVGDYLNVRNHMYTTIMYDRDNSSYYVDPNQTSRLNSLNVNSLYGNRYVDLDNSGYYADPHASSRLNVADVNRIRLMENIRIGCACTTKSIGTSSSGEFASCVSGVWVVPNTTAGYWRDTTTSSWVNRGISPIMVARWATGRGLSVSGMGFFFGYGAGWRRVLTRSTTLTEGRNRYVRAHEESTDYDRWIRTYYVRRYELVTTTSRVWVETRVCV